VLLKKKLLPGISKSGYKNKQIKNIVQFIKQTRLLLPLYAEVCLYSILLLFGEDKQTIIGLG
jgi:hypothetical protein